MKAHYLLSIFIFAAIISCHKAKDHSPGDSPGHDSFVTLKLKDISVENQPSPYYHFEYTNDKQIAAFDFSNGLKYDISYTGNDLTLMKNNTVGTSRDSINYIYSGNKLTAIRVTTDAGVTYRHAALSYYPSGLLQSIEWDLLINNDLFAREQSFTFNYYSDGNVHEIVQQYFAAGQLPAASYTDRYENYDDRKNIDGFTLVEPGRLRFPVLIPGIVLQRNNPRRIIRTGNAAVTYEVDYAYTYDNNGRPLTKTGHFTHTSGPGAGQQYDLRTTYTYYP